MFNSKIALPQDFFDDGNSIDEFEKEWLARHTFRHPKKFWQEELAESPPPIETLVKNQSFPKSFVKSHALKETQTESHAFMEWIPFGRASQVVNRDLNGSSIVDAETSFDELNTFDLSSTRFYEDNFNFQKSDATEFEENKSEVPNTSIFKDETYNGWSSIQQLPHPSQLRKKTSGKRKKPLGFDVDVHLEQIRMKTKELSGTSEENKVSDIFPSPIHEYENTFFRVTPAKRSRMKTGFIEHDNRL